MHVTRWKTRRIGPESVARRGERWWAVLQLAAAQHGVVSLAQLRQCGWTDSGVHKLVASGRLHRIHRGVYAVGRADLSPHGHKMAAVLACGDGAVLSHVAAGALPGIRPSAASLIDVTVPRAAPVQKPGLRVHRHPGLTRADCAIVDRIPVTSLSHTLIDLATVVSETQLARACDQAVILGVYDQAEMDEMLARSVGHKGVRPLRAVLAAGGLGEDVPASPLEQGFLDLIRNAGLPKPGVNRWIKLGAEHFRVDFVWWDARLVVETDGARYHSSGFARSRDEHRDAVFARANWKLVRFGWDDVFVYSYRTVAEVRRLRAQGLRHPPRDG